MGSCRKYHKRKVRTSLEQLQLTERTGIRHDEDFLRRSSNTESLHCTEPGLTKWQQASCGTSQSLQELTRTPGKQALSKCINQGPVSDEVLYKTAWEESKERWGLRDGSEVTSLHCSCREPKFASQHPHQPAHNCL